MERASSTLTRFLARATLGLGLIALALPGGASAAVLVKAPVDKDLSGRVACVSLAGEDLSRLPGAPSLVFSAAVVPASGELPEYCDVKGEVAPQIAFEVRMPVRDWNGRYLQSGCGGFCGTINIAGANDALTKGFAVAAGDMGHVGGMIQLPIWAESPDLRRDFGHRSTHVTAEAAKALVERFYDRAPAFSYWRGCSTGGRQGLTEAQWYPGDFDGIIAGDPAFPGRLGGVYNIWEAQHLFTADGSPVFSTREIDLLHRAVLRACDGLDGVKDGILSDPRACRFDVATLLCRGAARGDCLTPLQVADAKALYEGPRNSRGALLSPGGEMFGSEAAWNWPGTLAFADGSARFLDFSPNPPSGFTYRDYDFDRDPARVRSDLALYDPVPAGTAPDLISFARRGGRLIVYHGWADQGVSPLNTLDYYAQVAARQGGYDAVRAWFRVFMVPGMFHCRGGDAPNEFDLLPKMMAWVEKDRPPESVLAVQKDAKGAIVRERPLFPYPEYAAYNGTGDVNAASNWKAARPARAPRDEIKWIWGPAAKR
ncbi:MAG: tannase/feruloyl esterase family alpha/beta hydrolase [Caulobacteraceae bacterium]